MKNKVTKTIKNLVLFVSGTAILTSGYCLVKSGKNVDRYAHIVHENCYENRGNITICAHRGFSTKFVENSEEAVLGGFEEVCVDMCEIDVRLTKDNVPVICHNENLFWTTGKFDAISNMTYDEISSLTFTNDILWNLDKIGHALYDSEGGLTIFKRIYDQSGDTVAICTLDQLLSNEFGKQLCIELCPTEENFETYYSCVSAILEKYKDKFSFIMIKSDNYAMVDKMQTTFPDLRCGILIKEKEQLTLATTDQYDFYSIDYSLLSTDVLNGLPQDQDIMIWTLNYYPQYEKVRQMLTETTTSLDVTFITDYPDVVCDYLGRQKIR